MSLTLTSDALSAESKDWDISAEGSEEEEEVEKNDRGEREDGETSAGRRALGTARKMERVERSILEVV